MNLLNDKREHEQNQPHDYQEPSPAESRQPRSFDEPRYEQPEYTPRREGRSPRKEKKNSGKAFIITLVLLIVVSLVGYFGLFRDKGPETIRITDTPEQTPELQEGQPQAEEPPQLEQTRRDTPAIRQQPKTEPDVTPKTSSAQQSGFSYADNILNSLQTAGSGQDQLSSIFIDESTFWVEVSSASTQAAVQFFNSLKATSPDFIELTSSAPQKSTFIISGNLNVSIPDQTANISPQQLRQTLDSIFSRVNVTKLDQSVTTRAELGVFAFVKMRGSLNQCQSFIRELAQSEWPYNVSKIILTPQAGEMLLTLRFSIR